MRWLIVVFLFLIFVSSVSALELSSIPPQLGVSETQEEVVLKNIFIYSAPTPTGDEVKLLDEDIVQVNDTVNPYLERYDESSAAHYDYALECEEVVELTDIHDKSLNLKYPQLSNIADIKVDGQKTYQKSIMPYTYRREEYNVHPLSSNSVEQTGNLKFGTLYGQNVDTSQLEYSAGLFTRYDWKYFSLSTAYKKNQGTAYGLTTDNFYLSPEFKLNNTISISNVFRADTTRNRKTSEVVLNIKPLAYKGNERIQLEFGAGQTYDANNELFKTQFRFNTKFQL